MSSIFNDSGIKVDLEEKWVSWERFAFICAGMLIISPGISSAVWALVNSGNESGKLLIPTVIFNSSWLVLITLIANWKIKHKIVAQIPWMLVTIYLVFSHSEQRAILTLVPYIITGLYCTFAFHYLVDKITTSFDGRAEARPFLAALWMLTAVMAVVQTTRLSVFVSDSTAVQYSLIPGVEWFERHNCLTGYIHGSRLADAHYDNIYDLAFVDSDPFTTPLPPYASDMAPFTLDGYLYSPPFLLLPKLFTLITNDFSLLRPLWFSFSTLFMAAMLVLIVAWLNGPIGDQIIKLLPIFWSAMPVIMTMQLGGSQISILCMLVVGMLLIEQRQVAVGALLVSFAMITKMWPVLLLFPLLFQRRFRELTYIAGYTVILSVLSLLVHGIQPWDSYINYILPKIADGTAFVMIDESVVNLASNFSLIGIPFKLQEFGLHTGWQEARMISHVYTVSLFALAIYAGYRIQPHNRMQYMCIWLSLIVLGTLRSPLAPMHILIALLLLLVVVSCHITTKWHIGLFAVIWTLMTVLVPPTNPIFAMVLSMLRQLIIFSVIVWVVLKYTGKEKRVDNKIRYPVNAV